MSDRTDLGADAAESPDPANDPVRVRCALGVPNGGDFADPRRLVQLARDAEASGWDGFFLWDHVIRRPPWKPMVDPWVTLSAIAVATDTIVLGPMVTPLARRRTSVVARQTASLDLLSDGRLRLGVGLGAPDDEFTRFGEDADPARRAHVLDESLDLLEALWTGAPVTYRGDHVEADDVQFLPRPVRGRVPIWVAGGWPGGRPFRRAARYDGVWPVAAGGGDLSVEAFAACVEFVRGLRADGGADPSEPYDACFMGRSPAVTDLATNATLNRLVAAGMTWWIESLDDADIAFETHRDRVLAGPPAVAGRA